MALIQSHRSTKLWLDGHDHEGDYGVHSGVHYVNMKAMLDTEDRSYARLGFFADRVRLRGAGLQQDMVLSLR